jgi:hypothetical protein
MGMTFQVRQIPYKHSIPYWKQPTGAVDKLYCAARLVLYISSRSKQLKNHVASYFLLVAFLITASSFGESPGTAGVFLRQQFTLDVRGASADQSCVVSQSKFPHSRRDVTQLEGLLGAYGSTCGANLSALDSVYAAEARDAEWALAIEEKIKETAVGFPGLRVVGECHSSLCRLQTSLAMGKSPQSQLDFADRLIAKLKESPHEVSYFAVSNKSGLSVYLFSVLMPPPFLEPFLSKMKN